MIGNTTELTPSSPKQRQGSRFKDWYPYYAGFSATFAYDVIDRFLDTPTSILDPWNGSGTTTAAAARAGIAAHGVDLNPAMSIIATARLLPADRSKRALQTADRVWRAAQTIDVAPSSEDPLQAWFTPAAVRCVRSILEAIRLTANYQPETAHSDNTPPDEETLLGAFLYTSAMAAVRDLLVRFQGSNPTWIALPTSPRNRIRPSPAAFGASFAAHAALLATRLAIPDLARARSITIARGSALELHQAESWDACLASPPYATRVDYVRASAPELAVLGCAPIDQEDLRRRMMGTPLVRNRARETTQPTAPSVQAILQSVGTHPSHGSHNYYLPWLESYFADLDRSLRNIANAVRPRGRIAIVVQDSFYKEIHVDLQTVVVDCMLGAGRELIARFDYSARHLMTNVNSRARKHRADRRNTESLLVFA